MKNLFLAVVLGLTLLASAHAQSRPFRLTLGGANTTAADTGWLGVSLDMKRLSQSRTLSLYADAGFTFDFSCGGVFIPITTPMQNSQTYSGIEALGVSMRQPWGKGWAGVGLGRYKTYFSDCVNLDHQVTGLGGKVFVGFGGGLYFTEASLTVPSVPRYSQLSLAVGFRL